MSKIFFKFYGQFFGLDFEQKNNLTKLFDGFELEEVADSQFAFIHEGYCCDYEFYLNKILKLVNFNNKFYLTVIDFENWKMERIIFEKGLLSRKDIQIDDYLEKTKSL